MVGIRGTLALALLAGCGRLGFDARATGDANGDGPGGIDATDGVDGALVDAGPPDAHLPACAATYTFVAGASRYRIAGTDNWSSSELDCESDGAGMHLAVIDSAQELADLGALVGAVPAWVGISDRVTEGTWRGVTGVLAAYLPWSPGSGMVGGEDCVAWLPTSAMFVDQACTLDANRICECDGKSADPASY